MDLQILSLLSILFTFLLFILMVLKKTKNQSSKLPPGPKQLPIIGNLHQILGTLPHHALRNLAKKYGDIMYLKLGQVPTVVISSPEFAKEVMNTHDVTFASRSPVLASEVMFYGTTGIIFAPYGEYLKQLRKIFVVELLSTSRVQSFKPVREEEFSNLINQIAFNKGSPINLSEIIMSTIFKVVCRVTFGKTWKDQEELIRVVKETIKAAGGFDMADLFPSLKLFRTFSIQRFKLEKLHQVADRLFEKIIDDHKAKRDSNCTRSQGDAEEDMLDVLLTYHESNGSAFSLTAENIKALLLDIFAGGTFTTSTTVVWALSEMMKNPRIMNKAQEEVRGTFNRKGSIDEKIINEMKYLKCVVKEALRLHPPGTLIPRECQEKCEINGYEIPSKTKVIVNAWAIGTDPKYWTEAESFIPERFLDSSIDYKKSNFEYIPFGAGRRICPGISFAVINAELSLALLLYHFDWKLPNGIRHEDVNMTECFGVAVGRKYDLHLIPVAYYPSPSQKAQEKDLK